MKRKGWTLFTQDDIEIEDDILCSTKERKMCEADDRCNMSVGTGPWPYSRNHIKNPDARQCAVGKVNMLDCRRVELKKTTDGDRMIEVDEPVNHEMRIIGKIMLELQTACTCLGNAERIFDDCIACNALELLKIWVEGQFDSHEKAAYQLGIDEEDLCAGH